MSIVLGTTLRLDAAALGELAGLLARRLGVPLRLVHVCEDARAPFVLGTDEEGILGGVRAALDAEAARIHERTGADVHVHLAAGSVVDALVSVAELELAHALLLGGDPHAGRPVLGATPERVARRSLVPVITIREPRRLIAWLEGARPLRVLVGADLGRAAEAARAFAAHLARLGSCEVDVVIVVSPQEAHRRLGLPPPPDEHVLAAEAEEALRRDLERCAPAEERARVRVVAARSSADARLVTLADQESFDVVVVGQRRQSVVEALWYGSVARGVLRASPVSVACVPPALVGTSPVFRPPRVVLVGTDLDAVGDLALAHAVGLAAGKAVVHVAHVVAPGRSPEESRRRREQAWYALSRAVLPADGPGRDVAVERQVLEGAPAEQLLSLASRIGADLIVLGMRGRSGAARVRLGSVARTVGERAQVPVLLVPLAPA